MNVSTLRWKVAQFVERLWWKNYLKNKTVEDYQKWKYDYWIQFYNKIEKYLKQDIQTNPEATLLDAGCGPAGIFMIFKNNKTIAIDPLLDVYENDLMHFKKKMYPQVQFNNISLEQYQNQSYFDVTFCINAINHVKNMQLALDNLVSNTKKKGNLVISIDAHNYSILKKLFSLLPGDILHPHQYTLLEYENIIARSGMKILTSICLKKEFIFNYYVIVAEKL